MQKKVIDMERKFNSIAGRVVLINSSLPGTIIYDMSMYLLLKTVTDKFDKEMRTFFWQGNGQKRKYHLIKWGIICQSKEKGGRAWVSKVLEE